jgi:RNA polymerase-binding transcription factor
MYRQDLRAGQESADENTDDIVDRANNAYNRELMFSISDNERATLLQIENALNRMDEGTYGVCSNCGNIIALPRLEAVPWARFCIDCQELAEKGLLEVELA